MIFDTAAGIVERHVPAFLERFRQARLFSFPYKAHEVLPKTFADGEKEFLTEHFFLPFSTIAVEDKSSCTILWDLEKDQEGLSGDRGFIEIQPLTVESMLNCADSIGSEEQIKAAVSHYPPGSVIMAEGVLKMIMVDSTGFNIDGAVSMVVAASKEKGILAVDTPRNCKPEDFRLVCAPVLKNVATSLEEVFYFNAPDRFILEETSKECIREQKNQKKRPSDRVARSHQRPVYSLLRPHEIRKKLGLPEPEGSGTKRPHERRKHLRRYPNDESRWPQAHGRIVTIPATWIGPSDAVQNGRRYRIMLDL